MRLIKEVKSEEHVFSISEILQVKKQKLKRKEIKIRLLTIVNIVGLQQVNFFFLKFEQKVNYYPKLVSGFVCSGSLKDKQNTFK